eukprot:TRINITY_DN40583_c0_g1_i1.p1 TRINITY_DN40583_c0_g1~~TRINITY_DN40583_c0_g1_i1.p1  ORF type:complete len:561 (+),score=106.89 TRINITY_DN40583_c0_g1_i1:21-1703(+)
MAVDSVADVDGVWEGRQEDACSSDLTDDDIAACTHVLQRLVTDRSLLEGPRMRSIRKLLHGLLDDARGHLPDKAAVSKDEKKKHEKMMQRQRRQIQAEADRRWTDNAALRRGRQNALDQLQDQCPEASLMIADGAVADSGGASALLPLKEASAETAEPSASPELGHPRACYVCHRRFTTLHHFYDRLCPPCAELNWQKRLQAPQLTADFVAFVSGGRVKIGFEVAKKLLRCGATVLVTSRFPRDCCGRFAALSDFESFADRLQVYGVDFRSLDSVHRLCEELSARCAHLDAVVHNACQTVRRPARYYRDLAQREQSATCEAPRCLALGDVNTHAENTLSVDKGESSSAMVLANGGTTAASLSSAAMSQIRVLAEDAEEFEAEMPKGAVDVNGQQLDLREKHSWKMRLHEISTEELVECLCVNTISPFTLNAKLKELLMKSPRAQRFIINVSAMEGKFYRTKTANHPHTNMAKAALNMMTRTSAQDYVADGIYMNSADTGWINDENPLPTAHRIASEHNFQSPLDEVDAAARILDPIFGPLLSGERPSWGKFFKDYAETEW